VAAIQRSEGVVNGRIWSPGLGFEYPPERYYNAPKRPDARNGSEGLEPNATVASTGVFTATALPAHTTGLKSAASHKPAWLQYCCFGNVKIWNGGFVKNAIGLGLAGAFLVGFEFGIRIGI
jgi:hypothetical protein